MEISCWNQLRKNNPWTYVLHFIILCYEFSFSAISQACFHVRQKWLHFASFNLICRKIVMDKFLNSYGLIHSSSSDGICGVCTLLKHVTMPWFHCKLFKFELFLISKTKYIAWIRGTDSEVFLNKHAPSAVSVKTKWWRAKNCLLRIFMVWPNYYLLHHLVSVF